MVDVPSCITRDDSPYCMVDIQYGTSTIQYGESLVMHVGIYHTIWRISGNACGTSTIQYGESSLVMYVGHLPYNMENLW